MKFCIFSYFTPPQYFWISQINLTFSLGSIYFVCVIHFNIILHITYIMYSLKKLAVNLK